jgi:hypothetical protein
MAWGANQECAMEAAADQALKAMEAQAATI